MAVVVVEEEEGLDCIELCEGSNVEELLDNLKERKVVIV